MSQFLHGLKPMGWALRWTNLGVLQHLASVAWKINSLGKGYLTRRAQTNVRWLSYKELAFRFEATA